MSKTLCLVTKTKKREKWEEYSDSSKNLSGSWILDSGIVYGYVYCIISVCKSKANYCSDSVYCRSGDLYANSMDTTKSYRKQCSENYFENNSSDYRYSG